MTSRDSWNWMWAEACRTIEQAERLQRRRFEPDRSRLSNAAWEPPVDVFETADGLWIMVALPGVSPADVNVILENNLLTVTGRRRLPAVARGAAIHRLELAHGDFERRIALPARRWRVGRRDLSDGCLVLSLHNDNPY